MPNVWAHPNAAGRRAQRLCGAEERRAAVGARRRRALPPLTRRVCLTPGAAPKITLANVPPILASPPASNLIAFSGNVLTIPD